jgi:hypothetical protein
MLSVLSSAVHSLPDYPNESLGTAVLGLLMLLLSWFLDTRKHTHTDLVHQCADQESDRLGYRLSTAGVVLSHEGTSKRPFYESIVSSPEFSLRFHQCFVDTFRPVSNLALKGRVLQNLEPVSAAVFQPEVFAFPAERVQASPAACSPWGANPSSQPMAVI